MKMRLDQDELLDLIVEKLNVKKENIQLVVSEKYSDEKHDMIPEVSVSVDTKVEYTESTYYSK